MRRVFSIICFVIGAWLGIGEPLLAFVNIDSNQGPTQVFLLLGVAIFAGIPLLIGTALSPGKRLRELGLTLLIVSGLGLFYLLGALAFVNDPGFDKMKAVMPPMHVTLTPVVGVVNLVVLTAIGWLLYRTGRPPREEVAEVFR